MQDHMKGPERTCFWDEKLQQNTDPLHGVEGGFWAVDWDVKVGIILTILCLNSDFSIVEDTTYASGAFSRQ